MTFRDPRADIDEEIRLHLQARIDHLVAQGMSPDAARAEAARRFGDLDRGRAALYAQADRAARRKSVADRLDALRQDVRYVVRSLGRQPAFTAGVVATLALGIGLNAAIFGVADRVLLRAPAGVDRAGDVRHLETLDLAAGREPAPNIVFSYTQARAVIDAGVLEQGAVTSRIRMMAGADGRDVAIAYADAAFLPMLGVRPAAGRFFDAREGEPGADVAVAVVSYDFWQRALGGAAIGDAALTLSGRVYTVIGVTAPAFTGIDLDPVDAWLPLGVADFGRGFVNGVVIPWYRSDMLRAVRVLGRAGAADSEDVAASRVSAAFAQARGPGGAAAPRVFLRPIVPAGGGTIPDASRRLLARLAGVAAIVLLIACANATHLLLARGLGRHREIATRLAIGASRARVWRLLMIESVALALAGGVAAAFCGGWAAEALRAVVFPDSRWAASSIDARSIALTFVLAVAAGVACGLAPAAQATAPDVASAIRTGRGGSARRTRFTRATLLTVQTALSVLLLVASGLLVSSLVRLNRVSLGFDPDGLVTASIVATTFPGERGPAATPAAALADRVRAALPGADIAVVTPAPFGATRRESILVPGTTFEADPREAPQVMYVDPRYFPLMRTRVLLGRTFTAADAHGEPVTIVNEAMQRSYWGAALPPGACVLQYGHPCARVIGVVEDLREAPAGAAPAMRYYMPLTEHSDPNTIVVRAAGVPAADAAARIRAVLPAGQRATIEVVPARLARALGPWRAATLLFVALGVVSLALACAGIYSIVSYSASERLHELGVRVALGASPSDLLRLVIGSGFRFAVIGGVLGLAAAAAGGRLLASLLYDVSPFDPGVYAAAFAGLLAAGAGAMLPPARRASRVDAVVALREE
jgi:predicted permease